MWPACPPRFSLPLDGFAAGFEKGGIVDGGVLGPVDWVVPAIRCWSASIVNAMISGSKRASASASHSLSWLFITLSSKVTSIGRSRTIVTPVPSMICKTERKSQI